MQSSVVVCEPCYSQICITLNFSLLKYQYINFISSMPCIKQSDLSNDTVYTDCVRLVCYVNVIHSLIAATGQGTDTGADRKICEQQIYITLFICPNLHLPCTRIHDDTSTHCCIYSWKSGVSLDHSLWQIHTEPGEIYRKNKYFFQNLKICIFSDTVIDLVKYIYLET